MDRHFLRFAAPGAAILALTAASAQAQYAVSTFAGGAAPPTPGAATSLSLGSPAGLAVSSAGTVYLVSQNSVFQITPAGTATRIAGNARRGYTGDGGAGANAQLNNPAGVAVDSSGNVYIADQSNQVIRKVTAAGVISTYAGNGNIGYSGDGGPALNATFAGPVAVTVDAAGNLYVADASNNAIRMITTAGVISTIAGNGKSGFSGDGGAATSAQLSDPSGVTVDSTGNLYIADTLNNRVRKVTANGAISTLAGTGTSGSSVNGGAASAAQLNSPAGVAVDAAGNVYISESFNAVRKVVPAGTISTVAGGTLGFAGDGGPATSAKLNSPSALATDASGNLYIADTGNNRVREVLVAGMISTIAGNGTNNFSGDGGPATGAQMNTPQGIAQDAAGNIYVSEAAGQRIRKITVGGNISTFAGTGTFGFSGDGGPASSAQLSDPTALAVDAAGNLYVADENNNRIRMITPAGVISTVAGSGSQGFAGDGAAATKANMTLPQGVAVDSAGNVYVADTFNQRIRKFTVGGNISTYAGNGQAAYSGDGGQAVSASLNNPTGLAVDSAGNLYIADTHNNAIRKVTIGGVISTVAGKGQIGFSGDGGAATSATLFYPRAVAVDSSGNLYIADSGNDRIREVAGGAVTSNIRSEATSGAAPTINTIAGNGGTSYPAEGASGQQASFYDPWGIVAALQSAIYIADNNNAVHKLAAPTCSFSISPAGGTYSNDAQNGTFYLTQSACMLSLETPADWITISQQGTAAVTFSMTENTGQATRSGSIVITSDAGTSLTFKVTQAGANCQYSYTTLGQPLKLAVPLIPPAGGSDTLVLTVGPNCPWSVDSEYPWLTVAGPDGATSGVSDSNGDPIIITYTAAANSGNARVGAIYLTAHSVMVNQEGTPALPAAGIVGNAAGSTPTGGGLTVAYGTYAVTTAAAQGSLTTTLSGTSVAVSGGNSGGSTSKIHPETTSPIGPINAYLLYVSATQINFQMPWEFLGQSQVQIVVTTPYGSSTPVSVAVNNPSPEIFTIDGSGSGQGAIQFNNTTIYAAPAGSISGAQSQPATTGNVLVIYCDGLGAVTNQPSDGQLSPFSPLAQTAATPTVTIGGISASVAYSGLAPGYVGLYQVNVQVPPGVPTGNAVPLTLTIGGVQANTVTIAVQ